MIRANLSNYIFLFFLFTRLIAIFFSFPCISDIPLYFNYFLKGHVLAMSAYSDFTYEYPPLSLLNIYVPGAIFGKNTTLEIYYICFSCSLFLVDFFCLKTCESYCKGRLKMSENDVNYMRFFYSLFGLLLFKILYHRLDIVVALFFALSLFFFQAQNPKIKPAFFINALVGFFYKIVPAFTMPAAIILKAFSRYQNPAKIIKKIFIDCTIFAFFLAAIIFILEIYSDHNFIKNLLIHQQRGIQIESFYASLIMFFNLLSGKVSTVFHDYGSWNIRANFYFEILAKNLGNFLLISFYLVLFFLLLQKKNHRKIEISEENFLDITLITILLTLSFQRVLSTQFFIWLIPISTIWLAKNRSVFFLAAFSFLFLSTFFIFSLHSAENYFLSSGYLMLVNQDPLMILILVARNFLLFVITIMIGKKFFKNFS